jgi:chromosome segregation ATPase
MHPSKPRPARRVLVVLPLLVVALALGCNGADAPEEKLEHAADRVEDAREEASDVRDDVRDRTEAHQTAFQRAEKNLQRARRRLAEAEQEVARSRQRLDTRATDVAIFRQVQRELLDAETLEGSALTASVKNRVVTLTGVVDDAAARDRAVEIAKATPAVAEVRDRIQVQAAAADQARPGEDDGQRRVREATEAAGDAS